MRKEAPGRFGRLVQRIDKDPRLVKLLRLGRSRLPGDERYGDPLSLTGDQAPAVLGRRLSALTAEQPGALRAAGEVLVSEAVHERVEAHRVQLKRRWRFSAKGAPKGLKVYAAEPS